MSTTAGASKAQYLCQIDFSEKMDEITKVTDPDDKNLIAWAERGVRVRMIVRDLEGQQVVCTQLHAMRAREAMQQIAAGTWKPYRVLKTDKKFSENPGPAKAAGSKAGA